MNSPMPILYAGKRVSPLPEEWVISIFEGTDIRHIASFGAGEQAEEYAIAVARAVNSHAALEKVAEAAKDYFAAIGEIPWIPFLVVVKEHASKETIAKMESANAKYGAALAELEKAEGRA